MLPFLENFLEKLMDVIERSEYMTPRPIKLSVKPFGMAGIPEALALEQFASPSLLFKNVQKMRITNVPSAILRRNIFEI